MLKVLKVVEVLAGKCVIIARKKQLEQVATFDTILSFDSDLMVFIQEIICLIESIGYM